MNFRAFFVLYGLEEINTPISVNDQLRNDLNMKKLVFPSNLTAFKNSSQFTS